jgi:hypothetical protein
MSKLDKQIELAQRHVLEGRRIVAAQRERIARGEDSQDARDLLATFEQSLEIFEQDLQRLLDEQVSK